MRKSLLLVFICLTFVACGPGGGDTPPDGSQWHAAWSQTLEFTNGDPLDPDRDIGGYEIYITPIGVDFNDNNVIPITIGQVNNNLSKIHNEKGEFIYIQEVNISSMIAANPDNTIRNMQGDCTYWIAVRALKPNGSGEIADSDYSNPLPWGLDSCIG